MCIVFIGVGPSCIALLCHWVRHHREWFSQQKIILVEKTQRIGIGDLYKYKIRSNSVLPAFRHIIPKDITIEPMVVRLLDNVGSDFCPLSLVSEMLASIANTIVRKYNNIRVLKNTMALSVVNKQVTLSSGETITGLHVISTIGGHQILPDTYKHLKNVILSTTVLESCPDFSGKRVAVIGASHSAWSVVWTMALQYRQPFREINMFSRHKTRVFFRTTSEADIEGYEYTEDDICPETRQIHRFGGLRGDAKQTWRNQKNGIYPNIHHFISDTIPDDSAFDIVVIAFNYQRREIPGDGSYIKYGMMSGMQLECGEASFKSSKDGIWLYSNDLAKQITEKII